MAIFDFPPGYRPGSAGTAREDFMGNERDLRPPGQRSPYEALGQGGKIQKPPETRAEHVQGCGNPNCDTCMPTGRPQDAGGAMLGGGSAVERLQQILATELRQRLAIDPSLFLPWGDFTPSASSQNGRPSEADAKARQAATEEQRLRKTVEPYLLKASHAVAWDDVVGNEAARAALVEAIEHPVRHAATYAFYGVKPTRGVLLYGPPGCGKTMFGKAAASVLASLHGAKADAPVLLRLNGPEIQSPYVGVTEEKIREIFAYARAYKALHGRPLVVFIDEADAILPSRTGRGSRRALPWEESQVATFLTEMDGLEESGAFVILATNRPEAIDEAILRDGRCDRKIKVERPDQSNAVAILARALRDVPLQPGADAAPAFAEAAAAALFDPFRRLARVVHAKGMDWLTLADIVNGAMLVGLVEQAKAVAFRRDIAAGGPPAGLGAEDLVAAVDSVEAQNRGLGHTDALVELGERIDATITDIQPIRMGRSAA